MLASFKLQGTSNVLLFGTKSLLVGVDSPGWRTASKRLLQFAAGEKLKHLRLCGRPKDIVHGKIDSLRITRFSDALGRRHKIIMRMTKLDARSE